MNTQKQLRFGGLIAVGLLALGYVVDTTSGIVSVTRSLGTLVGTYVVVTLVGFLMFRRVEEERLLVRLLFWGSAVWAAAFGLLGALLHQREGGGETTVLPLLGVYFGAVAGASFGTLGLWGYRSILTSVPAGAAAGALSGVIFCAVGWLIDVVFEKHLPSPDDLLVGIGILVTLGALAGSVSSMITKRTITPDPATSSSDT